MLDIRLFFFGILMVCSSALAEEVEINSERDRLSYSIGIFLGPQIKQQFGELDYALVLKGLKDSGLDISLWKMNPDSVTLSLQKAQAEAQKIEADRLAKAAQVQLKEGESYLAENALKDGVSVTPSGLQYKIIEQGTGPRPGSTDRVKVDYEGRLINGEVFDSSIARGEPVTFPLDGVIPGWTEGVQLMKSGATFEFTIPSVLAYGSSGAGSIPPNSVLVFTVKLLEVNPES